MSARVYPPDAPASFLLADVGTAMTTVALFDYVAGQYRLIGSATAPSTAREPWNNAISGVQAATASIAETIGRPLLNDQGRLLSPTTETGIGVDHFAATVSAGDSLRVLVAGLLQDVSVASARRALHSIYAREVATYSLGDEHDEQERVNFITRERPDLIVVTGGVDGAAPQRLLELVHTLELAVGLLGSGTRPEVIFAGNRALRETVTTSLGGTVPVHVTENVRPTLSEERLADISEVLGERHADLKLKSLPGLGELNAWSSFQPVPTARAFADMIGYFAALHQQRVVGLDLGSSSATLVVADQEQTRVYVRADLGMGVPLQGCTDEESIAEILTWSSAKVTAATLIDYIQERALHTRTVPDTDEELALEQAIARFVLRRLVEGACQTWGWDDHGPALPDFKLLILAGATLARAPRMGQAVLVTIDAIQGSGLYAVAADAYGVLPLLGALAPQEPEIAVQILEGGVLVDVGWVISSRGRAHEGAKALHVRVNTEAGGEYRIDGAYGELITVPLAPGTPARLTLEPSRGCDVGFGAGRGKTIAVHGGAVGLVVDLRGRPLILPDDATARQELLARWRLDMGG